MHTIRPATRAVLLLVIAGLASACSSGTSGASGTPGATGTPGASGTHGASPTGGGGPVDAAGEWRLQRGTNAGTAIPIVPDADITLLVEGSSVSGRSACNQYGGEVVVRDGVVQFGDLYMTEMACAEPIMASEAAYHAALAKVRSAARDGDSLTLSGPGVELVFGAVAPAPTAALVGTPWILDSIISGDAVSSVMGDPAELLLVPDGSLSGTTGCRAFTARYTATERDLVVSDLVLDAVACPADLAAQDAAVTGVLANGGRYVIDGQRLALTATDGNGLGYTTRAPEIPPAP